MCVVLLPGMDGSGLLHEAFIAAMAPRLQVESVVYPADRFLDDRQLQAFVAERLPGDAPFLLIGESFSGPIAIRIAASRPPGLARLVCVRRSQHRRARGSVRCGPCSHCPCPFHPPAC